ncbi:unknown protein [Seminavis robusta]|uniref:Uncharacterized protein n=1 Tax=Seminavis robusta TaxID=568900 RepID=A0A9N8DAA5_9STRA|nr:unknown protein [Seminavis robusta]|eukprot:Sro10_g008000.1 n/a (135) ;mRNA; f:75881-76285
MADNNKIFVSTSGWVSQAMAAKLQKVCEEIGASVKCNSQIMMIVFPADDVQGVAASLETLAVGDEAGDEAGDSDSSGSTTTLGDYNRFDDTLDSLDSVESLKSTVPELSFKVKTKPPADDFSDDDFVESQDVYF